MEENLAPINPSPSLASTHQRTSTVHCSENSDGIHGDSLRRTDGLAVLRNDDRKDLKLETQLPSRPPAFVIRVAAIAGLGGILFGYDIGVISAALPYLTEDFDLNQTQAGWVVSILYVGGFLGAILGGSMCDYIGRKKSILITDILFLVGALLLLLAPSYSMVLQGRIVVGFGVAVSGIADVCYLHEISPSQWRGSVVSVNEACISLGFLLAFAAGSLLSNVVHAWRLMFGLSGIVALIQFLGMWYVAAMPCFFLTPWIVNMLLKILNTPLLLFFATGTCRNLPHG